MILFIVFVFYKICLIFNFICVFFFLQSKSPGGIYNEISISQNEEDMFLIGTEGLQIRAMTVEKPLLCSTTFFRYYYDSRQSRIPDIDGARLTKFIWLKCVF